MRDSSSPTARRRAAAMLLLAAVVGAACAGCESVAVVGARYRVERDFWHAQRSLSELLSRRSGATPADLERVRAAFLHVLDTGRKYPADDSGLRRLMGQCSLKNYDLLAALGRSPEAGPALDRILEDFPRDSLVRAEALWRRGTRSAARGDSAAAVEDFRQVARLALPDLRSTDGVAGHVLDIPLSLVQYQIRRSGRSAAGREADDALRYYHAVAAGRPRSREAFAARAYEGDVLGLMGRPREELAVLDSLQLDCRRIPEEAVRRPDLLLRLAGIAADDVGDPVTAHAYLDLLAREYPKSRLRGPAQLMRGRLFARQRRNEEADLALRGTAEDTSLPEEARAAAWIELARVAELQNNWDEAQRDYGEAATNFPLSPQGLAAPMAPVQHYAALRDQAGMRRATQDARRHYEDLLSRYPEAPPSMQARWMLVRCLSALEDWPATAALLSQIADRSTSGPDGFRALQLLAQVHEQKLKAVRPAVEDYRKMLARYPQVPIRPQVEAEIKRLGG